MEHDHDRQQVAACCWHLAASLLAAASASRACARAGHRRASTPDRRACKGRPYSPYADHAFPTNVYFGDTHVHTGLSADAGGSGTTLMPRDAYRYARGDQIVSNTGQPVKVRVPFDFYMVTDHSDMLGAIIDIIRGAPNIMEDPDGRQYHEDFNAGGDTAAQGDVPADRASSRRRHLAGCAELPAGQPGLRAGLGRYRRGRRGVQRPRPFTTFIAFEWTSLVAGNNLHRNVIFRDGAERAGQVVPYTTTPPIGRPTRATSGSGCRTTRT